MRSHRAALRISVFRGLLLVALGLCACADDPTVVVVDVQTDFVAGVEFRSIRVALGERTHRSAERRTGSARIAIGLESPPGRATEGQVGDGTLTRRSPPVQICL